MSFDDQTQNGDDIKLYDLTGTVLQITSRYTNEYLYDVEVTKVNDSKGQPNYELVGGYSVDVFLYLKSLLNFTYDLRHNDPIRYDETSVENASLDLYVASLSLLPIRAKYLDPTFVIGQSKILAFMDHAFEADTSNQNIFIIPFTSNLWICAITVWIIFLIGFLILNYYEKETSINDVIFHCITVTLQRGTFVTFLNNSTSIATIVLSMTLVVIMASYSGIMTSISAVNRYSITTIEAMIQSNYKIFVEFGIKSNSSSIKFMLDALMHMPIVVTLVRKIERSNFVFQSFAIAIDQVRREPAAYIIDEETGLFAVAEELGGFPCSWGKIPVFNLRYPWVMYMRRNATFRHQINLGLVRIRERGILKRIKKKWIAQPSAACYAGSDYSFKSITFPQVSSVFRLLLIGMILSCPIIFAIEKIISLYVSSAKTYTVQL